MEKRIACVCERTTLFVPVLPVAPAALGQSDMRNLGNEQKSIPLKQTLLVGHIDVPSVVDSVIFLISDILCVVNRAIDMHQKKCPRF